MGDEIRTDRFSDTDLRVFVQALEGETERLGRWIQEKRFDDETYRVGFEVEAWLIDLDCYPLPHNESFLDRFNSPLCLPELSRFNIEFNTDPVTVGAGMLSTLHRQLSELMAQAHAVAETMDMKVGIIGILPTVQEGDLTLDSMSLMNRYRALNERVMELRKNRPMQIDIRGRNHLCSLHEDVMLESACTSFQIHIQIPQSKAVEAYNTSIVWSAASVAASCNSPFLFGRELWEETRVPLFEQTIALGGSGGHTNRRFGRVSCGSDYAHESLFEFFKENLDAFPVILPQHFEDGVAPFPHLQLHNGTIWRWTRPLVSVEGSPHLRIEHRVMPSGPTEIDMIANLAFFIGGMMATLEGGEKITDEIPFEVARENFYRASQYGLEADVVWRDSVTISIRTLILEQLLPMARRGLLLAGVPVAEADLYLGLVEQRVDSRRTGSRWQRAWINAHEAGMQQLVGRYLAGQQSGEPVHRWSL